MTQNDREFPVWRTIGLVVAVIFFLIYGCSSGGGGHSSPPTPQTNTFEKHGPSVPEPPKTGAAKFISRPEKKSHFHFNAVKGETKVLYKWEWHW